MFLAAGLARTRVGVAFSAAVRSLATQSSTLVVADSSYDHIKQTLPALTAAFKIGQPIVLLIANAHETPALAEARRLRLDCRIIHAQHAAFEHGLPESLAAFIVHQLTEGGTLKGTHISHIVAPSSAHTRAFLPRAAALLGAHMLDSVTAVIGPSTFQRPVFTGSALATVELLGPGPRILSVRATAFAAAELGPEPRLEVERVSDADIQAALSTLKAGRISRWVSKSGDASTSTAGKTRPELTSAKVVVAGGRGMQSEKGQRLLNKLADALGAAVGASRAAVDAGLVPNEFQVGQTGKVVAPDLYLALGISGAIQHVSGMKDSKIIAAINKDPEAAIFKVSDVGLVADGPAAVEELLKKLYDGDDGGGAASVVDGDEDGGPAGFHGELSFTRVSDLKLD